MKQLMAIAALIIVLFFSSSALYAQDSTKQQKNGTALMIDQRGIKVGKLHSPYGDWNHVKPSWNATNSYYAMTRVDSNDYVYTIRDIHNYYGVGMDTLINGIGLVFRDSLGKVQTSDLFIPVIRNGARSKMFKNAAVTTIPSVVTDSTESITIHFHPFQDLMKNKNGDKSFRTFSGTIYVYSGLITNPPNDMDGSLNDAEVNEGDFDTHWVMLDLGVNMIRDNTNYNSAAAKAFLNVPANRQNSSLFDLRQGKSVNVNIYPFMETLYAVKRKKQRINISTGIGLQLYNFRYENPVSFTKNPNSVVLDAGTFKKDKVGFDYLNIPLMITFKTKLQKQWLIYGVGITGGYSIATWTKQVSGAGKVKFHDDFGFSDFNSCLMAEIGLKGIRFYGTYQLTNMFQNSTGMNQHPVSFGIRFFAI